MPETPFKTGDLLKILASLTNYLDVISQKSSFRLGLGTLAMGGVVVFFERVSGVTFLCLGAFFVASKLGSLLDGKISKTGKSSEE